MTERRGRIAPPFVWCGRLVVVALDPIGGLKRRSRAGTWPKERRLERRTVLEALGGGRRYEVFLVWDAGLNREAIAKVLDEFAGA